MLEELKIKRIVEAALLAAHEPLTIDQLMDMFIDGELGDENPRARLRNIVKTLVEEAEQRGVELKQVASGYRYHVPQELSPWISKLWAEKPPRYSRALLETLALVAYRQPVTRGDIEQVRGVAVSQNIMRTLLERDWVRVVGQREVPGKPAMYGTTKAFLDYFNLRSLDQLPSLPEIRALVEPTVVPDELEDGSPDNTSADQSAASGEVSEPAAVSSDVSDYGEESIDAGIDEADDSGIHVELEAVDLNPEDSADETPGSGHRPGDNVVVLPTVDHSGH